MFNIRRFQLTCSHHILYYGNLVVVVVVVVVDVVDVAPGSSVSDLVWRVVGWRSSRLAPPWLPAHHGQVDPQTAAGGGRSPRSLACLV